MSDRLFVGAAFRAIRLELRLRQCDVAARAGVSQQTISRLERGEFATLSIATYLAIADALNAEVPLAPRLRGSRLIRLRDRRHASLQNSVAAWFREAGWTVAVEESFNHYGERGSVDVLAWHPEQRILVIIEVKSEITDLQETLRTLDMKTRVVPKVVRASRGWNANHVAALLVLPASSGQRRVIREHGALVAASLPSPTREVKGWVANPVGAVRGVVFLRNTRRPGTTPDLAPSERVRLTKDESARRTRRSGRSE